MPSINWRTLTVHLIVIVESVFYRYQLIDDAGQRFSIKPGTVDGYALYTTSVNINYEESDNYNVIVMTTDNGNPPMSYRHSISIQVTKRL